MIFGTIEVIIKTFLILGTVFLFMGLRRYYIHALSAYLSNGSRERGLARNVHFSTFIKSSLFRSRWTFDQSENFIKLVALAFSFLPLAVIPFCENFYVGLNLVSSEVVVIKETLFFVLIFWIFSDFLWNVVLSVPKTNSVDNISPGTISSSLIINLSFLLILFTEIFVYEDTNIHMIIQRQLDTFSGLKINYYGFITHPLSMMFFLITLIIKQKYEPTYSDDIYHLRKEDFIFKISREARILTGHILFVILYFGGYSVIFPFTLVRDIFPSMVYILEVASMILKLGFTYFISSMAIISVGRATFGWHYKKIYRMILPLVILNMIVAFILQIDRFGSIW